MLEVPFTTARAFEEPPNSWKRVRFNNEPNTAIYTCPNGHTGLLDDHHIDVDGTVTPSVVCTECDFHDYLKLVGWDESDKTPSS